MSFVLYIAVFWCRVDWKVVTNEIEALCSFEALVTIYQTIKTPG
jgi:hypothetical protein